MRYDNPITSFLLGGEYEKAINGWKRTLQRVVKSNPENWTYNQFNSLYGAMDFILNFDPFVKGAVNKRLYLLKSYDYNITAGFETLVEQHLSKFYDVLYNVIFFGKCLIRMERSVVGYKIKIIPPQKYYVNEGEIIFLTSDEYNIDSLIYFGEELFDVSSLAISVINMSMKKEHNDDLWYNNHRYLSGFVHSKISTQLANDIPTGNDNSNTDKMTSITEKVVNEVSNLSETGGVLSLPEGIEIEHKDLANPNTGNSYLQYIENKKRDIENIILGRSTQQNDTSYASEKIRFMSTIDIQFADIKTLEHIANTIITYIKWHTGQQNMVSKFAIQDAMDEDEINVMQVLNLVRNLGAIDDRGNPLTIDIKWLSEVLRVPFENKGKLQLGIKASCN